jgi:hypothetical protein
MQRSAGARGRYRLRVARVVRVLFVVWIVAVIAVEVASSSSRRLGLFVAALWAVGLLRRWQRKRRMRRVYGW